MAETTSTTGVSYADPAALDDRTALGDPTAPDGEPFLGAGTALDDRDAPDEEPSFGSRTALGDRDALNDEPAYGSRTALGALSIEPRTRPPATTSRTGALRLPAEHDPAPRHGRMLVLSAWSALLVLVGLVIGARMFAAILLNSGPEWLVPAVVAIGVVGIVAAGLAFAAIHRGAWAYLALGTATLALTINLALTLTYL